MAIQTMTAKEARDNFTDLLGAVYYGKEPVIVEKKGRAFAVVINPEEYTRLQKLAKEQLFKIAGKIQARNTRFNEEEVLIDINKAIKELRTAEDGNQ